MRAFNWWEQLIFLFALDAAWNGTLAYFRTESRSIRTLKWLDKKTSGKKYNVAVMTVACFFYGLVSVYGFFGSARFVFRLRKYMKKARKINDRRNKK